MTDRPMLFSAPMIRALLDGRKTQTRRVLKPQPETFNIGEGANSRECFVHPVQVEGEAYARIALGSKTSGVITKQKMPYMPGDRLYVREAWENSVGSPDEVSYRATAHDDGWELDEIEAARWKPSIHMPRWASRLTLIVEAVKVERLTDISEADAQAEGVEPVLGTPGVPIDRHYAAFMQLWDSLHGEGATYANPWVVAVTFRVVRANIDAVAA
jgi:hypothetical protein